MSWLKDHWKTIAVIAGSTLVFVAVTALTGGLGAPALVALAAGGFSSGVAGYGLDRWLNHQKATIAGALTAGLVSTVVTVATAGVGRLVAPTVGKVLAPIVARVAPALPGIAPQIVQNVAVGAALGGPLAAAGQVAQNAVARRPLGEDVGTAFATGTITGALQDPLTRAIGKPIYDAAAASRGASSTGAAEALPRVLPRVPVGGTAQPETLPSRQTVLPQGSLVTAPAAEPRQVGAAQIIEGQKGDGIKPTTETSTASKPTENANRAPAEDPEAARATAAALRTLNDYAAEELAKGTRNEDPVQARNATENQGHINRMVATVDANRDAIAKLGIDPDATKTAILYSDLGKNASYLDAYAQKVFPELYADPATRGLAKFRAFLLHEEPGIDLVRQKGQEAGLSPEEIQKVVDGIVGHNGPGTEGSWWQQNFDKQIANQPGNDQSALLGKPYPLPAKQAAVHTFLDRIDQGRLLYSEGDGWAGGPKKIMNDLLNQGQTLESAARNSLIGNPEGTMLQLNHLAKLFPDVAQLDFVKQGTAQVEATKALMDHVTFRDDGKTAVINTPNGPVTATDFASFWRGLAQIAP